jgi:hypothetical protein
MRGIRMRTRPGDLSRREWVRRALIGLAGPGLLTSLMRPTEAAAPTGDAEEFAAVQALAKKAGLAPFPELQLTDHFRGTGNASAEYCKNALTICEALSKDFLKHFRDRGFNLALPAYRMTVITLKDSKSYSTLLGDAPGATVGGHYDLETNRLVVFDFRPNKEEVGADPERVNLFTLIHEALHTLCYNTGLLSRDVDVPACISEGLATYGELWRSKGRGKIGGTNGERLKALIGEQNNGAAWVPIADLLKNDDLFNKEETVQVAYSEAWPLVHYLLEAKQLPRFQAYLAKLPPGASAAKRLRIAEEELGSLEALDKEVFRHAKAQLRRVR